MQERWSVTGSGSRESARCPREFCQRKSALLAALGQELIKQGEEEWVSLLEVISEHIGRAKHIESSFIIERLQSLLPHQALLVAKIARGLVESWGGKLGDFTTSTAANAPELVDLAITLHRLGPDTREVGINLFEDLLHVSTYAARETLDQIDNRFRNTAPRARRRLPRRAKTYP